MTETKYPAVAGFIYIMQAGRSLKIGKTSQPYRMRWDEHRAEPYGKTWRGLVAFEVVDIHAAEAAVHALLAFYKVRGPRTAGAQELFKVSRALAETTIQSVADGQTCDRALTREAVGLERKRSKNRRKPKPVSRLDRLASKLKTEREMCEWWEELATDPSPPVGGDIALGLYNDCLANIEAFEQKIEDLGGVAA